MDEYLQEIKGFIQKGWPERANKHFTEVFANQQDLKSVDECLLYKDRVMVPKMNQMPILKLLDRNRVDGTGHWLQKSITKDGCVFARFGLPDVLVSDNGPPFNSKFFKCFLEKHGIKVMKCLPYNPSSNEQAERLVRTVKEVLKKFLMEPDIKELDMEEQISLFLFNFRNNKMTSDGHFPSERIIFYAPKIILDLINPKKLYKQFLTEPQPTNDFKYHRAFGREIPEEFNRFNR